MSLECVGVRGKECVLNNRSGSQSGRRFGGVGGHTSEYHDHSDPIKLLLVVFYFLILWPEVASGLLLSLTLSVKDTHTPSRSKTHTHFFL
jgi:hypothetical protein